MEQIKGLVTLVQEAIENGATTVEEVHRSIANMPLEALKSIDQIEGPISKVQEFQDRTIGGVYDTIRMVNMQVGEIAKSLLDKMDKPK
jgi:hypothetical protein